MIAEHFAALQSRIEAGPDLDGRVFDTIRTLAGGGLAREQYVILYHSAPGFELERLAAIATFNNSTLTFTIDLKIVGTSRARVMALLERVLGQIVGHVLVVDGRVCAPIEVDPDDVGPILPDESVEPFLYYCNVAFDLVSEPA